MEEALTEFPEAEQQVSSGGSVVPVKAIHAAQPASLPATRQRSDDALHPTALSLDDVSKYP
jgi:hypothetical protein